MNSRDYVHIWQRPDWPKWRFDLGTLAGPLADVSRAQGMLLGRLADVGTALRDQASLTTLTEDVLKTSEIEGEQLDADSVRFSIARRLGVDIRALARTPWLKAGLAHLWFVTPLNERQVKLLDRLLDGFEGKLTSSKWAAIAKCSPDTALRDIDELIVLGVPHKTAGGGRSTAYALHVSSFN